MCEDTKGWEDYITCSSPCHNLQESDISPTGNSFCAATKVVSISSL